jgi:hypothetical protein
MAFGQITNSPKSDASLETCLQHYEQALSLSEDLKKSSNESHSSVPKKSYNIRDYDIENEYLDEAIRKIYFDYALNALATSGFYGLVFFTSSYLYKHITTYIQLDPIMLQASAYSHAYKDDDSSSSSSSDEEPLKKDPIKQDK